MKTSITLASVLLLLLLGINTSVKAQTFTLTNDLNCSVELFYEARNAACSTPASGPLILNSMSTMTINVNPNIIGVCLIIRRIGGVQVAGNHLWVTLNPNFTPCHNAAYGQSGTTTNPLCVNYTATLTANSWTIR